MTLTTQQIDERRHEFLRWFTEDARLMPSGRLAYLAHNLAADERVTKRWLQKIAKRLEGKPKTAPYWSSVLMSEMSKLKAPKPEPKPLPTPAAVRVWLQQPRTRAQLADQLAKCPVDHGARQDLERAFAAAGDEQAIREWERG